MWDRHSREAEVEHCKKCGADRPSWGRLCPKCGYDFVDSEREAGDHLSEWWPSADALLDPEVLFSVIGGLLLCAGPFLSWTARTQGLEVTKGFQMAAGPVVLATGVFYILALLLARGGKGMWSLVMIALSAVALILASQQAYYLHDHHIPSSVGLYIAIAGGVIGSISGVVELMRVRDRA
jgi:hypothetical protein